MKCKLYDALRDQLFHDISDIYNINIDISQDLFIRIMCATDYDSICPLVNFVNSAFDIRSRSIDSLVHNQV